MSKQGLAVDVDPESCLEKDTFHVNIVYFQKMVFPLVNGVYKRSRCLLTLGWIDDDGIFYNGFNLFRRSSFIFISQNSEPLSVARQQSVIIPAVVVSGTWRWCSAWKHKQSCALWMKWSKNSAVEMVLVWEYEWLLKVHSHTRSDEWNKSPL